MNLTVNDYGLAFHYDDCRQVKWPAGASIALGAKILAFSIPHMVWSDLYGIRSSPLWQGTRYFASFCRTIVLGFVRTQKGCLVVAEEFLRQGTRATLATDSRNCSNRLWNFLSHSVDYCFYDVVRVRSSREHNRRTIKTVPLADRDLDNVHSRSATFRSTYSDFSTRKQRRQSSTSSFDLVGILSPHSVSRFYWRRSAPWFRITDIHYRLLSYL